MFVSLPTGHRKSLMFLLTIPILKHLSRQPRNHLLIVIDQLQAVTSNQISSCEKLGVEVAKLDKVHGVNKEHEILFTSQETLSKHFTTIKDLKDRIVGVVVNETHRVQWLNGKYYFFKNTLLIGGW